MQFPALTLSLWLLSEASAGKGFTALIFSRFLDRYNKFSFWLSEGVFVTPILQHSGFSIPQPARHQKQIWNQILPDRAALGTIGLRSLSQFGSEAVI